MARSEFWRRLRSAWQVLRSGAPVPAPILAPPASPVVDATAVPVIPSPGQTARFSVFRHRDGGGVEVLRNGHGAECRMAYEQAVPEPGEEISMWDAGLCRGRKGAR